MGIMCERCRKIHFIPTSPGIKPSPLNPLFSAQPISRWLTFREFWAAFAALGWAYVDSCLMCVRTLSESYFPNPRSAAIFR
jgi:hypothetical protein